MPSDDGPLHDGDSVSYDGPSALPSKPDPARRHLQDDDMARSSSGPGARGRVTLVLGGARSGKSALAERLAAAADTVTYIATMHVGDDAGLAERVATHRRRRPEHWRTVEADDDLIAALENAEGTVLLDSLGPWVAGHAEFAADVDGLCAALGRRAGDTIVVSDEVGLGVVPSTAAGGQFRDALGTANQAVAAVADRVLLVVAGRVLVLDPPPER